MLASLGSLFAFPHPLPWGKGWFRVAAATKLQVPVHYPRSGCVSEMMLVRDGFFVIEIAIDLFTLTLSDQCLMERKDMISIA